MSKLFDTLEQIRENEEAVPRKTAKKPTRKAKKNKGPVRPAVLFFVILGAVLCAILYFVDFSIFLPHSPTHDSPIVGVSSPQPDQPDATVATDTPQTATGTPLSSYDDPNKWREILSDPGLVPKQRAILLNNLATRQILEKEHWKGISILEEARKLYPDSPDILINYAVALTELGIYEVAALYFEEAYKINPAHPALIKNIAMLNRNNIMGEKLMNLYGQ